MTSSRADTAFWILTTLAAGPQHGYAILRGVSDASHGGVALKTATLYATLDRLEALGQVEISGAEVVDGRARRYYRLTAAGNDRLADEAADLERRAVAARAALDRARAAAQLPPRPSTARARSAIA